jgi:hypothetical protein
MTVKIGFGILWVVKGVEGVRYPVKIAVEQIGGPRLGRLYNMLTCQFSACPNGYAAPTPRTTQLPLPHYSDQCLITRTRVAQRVAQTALCQFLLDVFVPGDARHSV